MASRITLIMTDCDSCWCGVQAAAGSGAPQWDGETWASLGRVSKACEAAVRLLERLGDETDASESHEVSGPSQRQGMHAAAAASGAGHDRYRSPFGDTAVGVGGGRHVMADSDELHQGSFIEAAHAHAHGQLYADVEAGRGMPSSSSSVEAGLGSPRGLDSVDIELLEAGVAPGR